MAAAGGGLTIVYEEHFESGDGGWEADNTGGTYSGLWRFSVGRWKDGLPNHTPDHSWYYGAFERSDGGGHYIIGTDHQGTLISPVLPAIPQCGTTTLSFSYFLDTRPELDRDLAEVYVVEMQGGAEASQTRILSRADGTLPETGIEWLVSTYDLTPFAGDTIRLKFFFDTGDVPLVDPEGWYVDDVVITNVCHAADLSVTKQVDDATPNEGQQIVYTITAANSAASNAAATGVTVTDALPDGVTLVSALATEGQYDETTDTWAGLELAPGESQTLTITVTVNAGTAGQTLVNTAVVSGGETDPDEGNNQDTVVVTPQLVAVTDAIQFITPLGLFRPDGGLSYSPFKRPADAPEGNPDHPYLGNWTTHSDEATLLAALAPWQLITVTNHAAADFRVTGIAAVAAGSGAEFVDVTDENLQPVAFPVLVPSGTEAAFWAFYSPAEPDWSVAPYRPAHTFGRDDHLEIATDLDGGRVFSVRLVGASTYDGDVTYNGVVDLEDFALVDQILDAAFVAVPGDAGWDPTADVNVRFPNQAAEFPEIGLGDFGPINIELDAVRAPFLDLDWDNGSGVRGVDYAASYGAGGPPVAVADADARFANSPLLFLDSVTVAITNFRQGDVLAAETTGTNVLASYNPQSGVLSLAADTAAPIPKATVGEFETVLRSIRYSSEAVSPDAAPRVIEFQAIGDQDQFGQQQSGNLAVTTVNIESSSLAAAFVLAAAADEPAAASPAAASDDSLAATATLASSSFGAAAEEGTSSEAVSAAAVDLVIDSLQPETTDTEPAGPFLADDLLASLALYLQESGQEEEDPQPAASPPVDPQVLFT